jgi:hypothetical protein
MCTFCNKKNWKDIFTTVFLVQYEKRKLACRTLYIMWKKNKRLTVTGILILVLAFICMCVYINVTLGVEELCLTFPGCHTDLFYSRIKICCIFHSDAAFSKYFFIGVIILHLIKSEVLILDKCNLYNWQWYCFLIQTSVMSQCYIDFINNINLVHVYSVHLNIPIVNGETLLK